MMTVNIFVCYSHQDKSYLAENDLLGFLKGLQRDGISFWWDEALVTGESWDKEIRNRIRESHIALVLVSQWMLDSAYCVNVEINAFLQQCRKTGLVIFPIIFSPCDWERHEWLKSRQFLPSGSETIEEHYSEPGRRKRLFLTIRKDLEKQIHRVRQSDLISSSSNARHQKSQYNKDSQLSRRNDSTFAAITVNQVSSMFPEANRASIACNLPFVLDALKERGLTGASIMLFALATIRAETRGSFRPVEEPTSIFNTSPGGRPFDLYDFREDLGNQGPPDGEMFKPRGFLGLTGRKNYTKYSEALGLNDELVRHPEKANEPEIAGHILARSLELRQKLIEEAIALGDLGSARRLSNGGSYGMDLFIETFHRGERLLNEQYT